MPVNMTAINKFIESVMLMPSQGKIMCWAVTLMPNPIAVLAIVSSHECHFLCEALLLTLYLLSQYRAVFEFGRFGAVSLLNVKHLACSE